jgi:chaperone modulatory protein CbpM
MNDKTTHDIEVLDENLELSLAELCRSCSVRAETVIALVEEGLIDPCGSTPLQWTFRGPALRRLQIALRLQQDLHINPSGAALAVDLLDEIDRLRERLRVLEDYFS